MPTINSSLGSKSFASTGMKEFVIPDESGEYADDQHEVEENEIRKSLEAERKFMEMRRSPSGTQKISDGARKRIEVLCGMTRLTREVDIEGNVFVLRSLKSKEVRQVLNDAAKYEGNINFVYELRKKSLFYSLESVAGIDMQSFLGTNDPAAKESFIDDLDEGLIEKLYREYSLLVQEVTSKYGANTVEEGREVIEDIKK